MLNQTAGDMKAHCSIPTQPEQNQTSDLKSFYVPVVARHAFGKWRQALACAGDNRKAEGHFMPEEDF